MKRGVVPLKSLIRILVIITLFIVIGITIKPYFSNDDEILVEEEPDSVVDQNLAIDNEQKELNGEPRPEQGVSVYIGQPIAKFQAQYGEPNRIEQSYYGYDHWVYTNTDLYMIAGVEDGKVVTIAVAGEKIDTTPFKIGENLESVYSKVSIQPEVELEFEKGVYRFELFENDINSRPLIELGDIYAQLYFDNFEGKLLFIRYSDKETLLKHQPYDMTYRGELVEVEMSDVEWEAADQASERQIFELTNLIRQRYSFQGLALDEETREVAYFHSQDMYDTETFSHISEKYGDLADRLEARNIFYESAGENIAYLYADSIAVVAGWLNSQGHRETFLDEDFTHLGVGVYKKYYTQNFLQKSWGEGLEP